MDNKQLRDKVIDYGIAKNYSVAKINNELKRRGLPSYNPLTRGKNYFNIPGNLLKEGGEFAKGLVTFGGEVIKPVAKSIDTAYRQKNIVDAGKSIAKDIKSTAKSPDTWKTLKGAGIGAITGGVVGRGLGAIPGAMLGAQLGNQGGRAVVDAYLSPYNMNVDKIINSSVNVANKIRQGENLRKTLSDYGIRAKTTDRLDPLDIVQGMQTHPLSTSIDAFYPASKVAKPIIKSVTNNPNRPLLMKQLIPDEPTRKFHRDITEALQSSRAKSSELYKSAVALDNMPKANRKEIVNYLITNKGKLTKQERIVARGIRKDLNANQDLAVKLGYVDAKNQADDIVAQYVMQNIKDKSNLLHDDIKTIINGGELRPTAQGLLSEEKNLGEINKLIKEGSDLYDRKKIVLLSQKFATSEDPLREVIASTINNGNKKYFDTSRIIGRTGADRLANVLDDTLEFQLNQVGYSREGVDIIDKLLANKTVAGEIDDTIASEIKSNFNKSLADDFIKGELPDLNKALRKSGIKGKIDDVYYEAINNAFKKPVNTGLRRLLNAFKKAVLGQPHWFSQNRVGNWTNNFMEGVNLVDYLDTAKYAKLAPKQLKQQTSFASYVNEGIPGVGNTTFGGSFNKLNKAIGRYRESNKGLGATGTLVSDMLGGISDVTANPWFKLEATAEFTDRYANFIRQAKREAEATGKSVESILREANKNKDLFNKLNTQVNKSLGDYVGRNYALPAGLYNNLGELVPFYRFLTQTGRTTAHQLANSPLAFHSIATLPGRLGQQENKRIIKEFNLDPEQFRGGVPYRGINGNTRTIGFDPIPVGALTSLDILSSISPYVSSIPEVLKFRKNDRIASTPRLTEQLLTSPSEADKFKPTGGERMQLLGRTLMDTMFNPWIQLSRYGIPGISTLLHHPVQSLYDTSLYRTNPMSFVKDLPSETILNAIGVKSQSNYPARRQSKSAKKKDIRRANWNKKIIYENELRKKGK